MTKSKKFFMLLSALVGLLLLRPTFGKKRVLHMYTIYDSHGEYPFTEQPSQTIYFNKSSSFWHNDLDWNLFFLRTRENYANTILKTKGHLFLNEIYDMLGMARTSMGAVSGWIMKDGAFVDFGIKADTKVRSYIRLNLNVQGVIFDKI